MNSSPAVTPTSSKPRLIIKHRGTTLESCPDHKVYFPIFARNYEEDEKIAAEALLMLSATRPSPPQKSGHHCTLCQKIFDSHQALGGHMTCHRKKTTPTTNPSAATNNEEISIVTSASSSYNQSDVVSDNSDCTEKGRRHKCSTCSATFSTGQQLGGHKRKHYQQTNGNKSDGGKRRLLELFNGGDGGTIATVHPDMDLDLDLGLDLDLDLKLSLA